MESGRYDGMRAHGRGGSWVSGCDGVTGLGARVGSWRRPPADGPEEMHVPNRESSSRRVPISAAFGIRTSECCCGARRPLPPIVGSSFLGMRALRLSRRSRTSENHLPRLYGASSCSVDADDSKTAVATTRFSYSAAARTKIRARARVRVRLPRAMEGGHTRTSLVEEGAHGHDAQAGGHDHNVLGLGDPATTQPACTRTGHVSEGLIESAMAGDAHRK